MEQTEPVGFPENGEKDDDAEAELLKKLRSGTMKTLDQSLLPFSHLHHHDSRDGWAPFCNICRSAKQRLKLLDEAKFDLKP